MAIVKIDESKRKNICIYFRPQLTSSHFSNYGRYQKIYLKELLWYVEVALTALLNSVVKLYHFVDGSLLK